MPELRPRTTFAACVVLGAGLGAATSNVPLGIAIGVILGGASARTVKP